MAAGPRSRVLAVPHMGERMGGVARASRLVRMALDGISDQPVRVVTLIPDEQTAPSAWHKLRFGTKLVQAQRSGEIEWILFMHLGLARVLRGVPRAWRVPYGVFLHGIEAWAPLGAHDRRVLRGAALRIANSDFTARMVRERNPDIGDVVACPLAIDPEHARVSPPAEARQKRVLVVGRMAVGERYKGHEQLIEAWPGVLAAVPDAELVVVGDGDDRARLEALARQSPASHRIRFTGFVTRRQLSVEYAEAAVFALPSRGEGFGLVYLEAMAHGLPCIGSRSDAAGEVIVDGKTGLLVDYGRPDSLRAAVLTLLGDAELRRRFGDAGRLRVQTTYAFTAFQTRLAAALAGSLEHATTRARGLTVPV